MLRDRARPRKNIWAHRSEIGPEGEQPNRPLRRFDPGQGERALPCGSLRPEHDPEKWEPVFGRRSCSTNRAEEAGFMGKLKVRHGDWVVVCDGKKALVL